MEVDGRIEFIDSIDSSILECEALKITSHRLIFSRNTKSKQVGNTYATVWTSIMGNCTYNIYNTYRRCVNGCMESMSITSKRGHDDIFIVELIGARYIQQNTGGNLFSVAVVNVLDNLKFISCGERGFRELLLVFDHIV